MIPILHVGPDWQFYRLAQDQFEALSPAASTYVVMESAGTPRNGHMQASPRSIPLRMSAASMPKLARLASASASVVIHGLNRHTAVAALAAPKNAPVMWSGWGYDYYPHLYDRAGASLLGGQTQELVRTEGRGRDASRLPSRWAANRMVSAAASRVDLFSSPIPQDFDVMRRNFPKCTAEYIRFNYGSFDSLFGVGSPRAALAPRPAVLVGNSATPSNNHLEAFAAILDQPSLNDHEVVVPLSYGDPWYADSISRIARNWFGDRVTLIRELMPLAEYNAMLGRCEVVVMNHYRQQAIGNIVAALLRGSRVYMSARSPLFDFLNGLGAVVHELDGLGAAGPIGAPLNQRQWEENRLALHSYWSEGRVLESTEHVIARLTAQRR